MIREYAQLVGADLYNDYSDFQTTTVKQYFNIDKEPVTGIDGETTVDTDFAFNAELQKTVDARKAADNYIKWCGEMHPVYTKDKAHKLVGYATFNPKFSTVTHPGSNSVTDFSKHKNYYKLLEDFNVYNSLTGENARQGAVELILPSEATRLSESELEAYKQRLRDTGFYSEKEIDKYAKKAQMTFQELVSEEIENRAEYEERQAPLFDSTMQEITDMLQKEFPKDTGSAMASDRADQKQAEADKMEIEASDVSFSLREEAPPVHTMVGYKVFRVDKNHPGQLYPTKISNPGKQGTPLGVWLNADTGEIARNSDGTIKTNTKGRIAVKADSDNSGTLAWRPGWHLGQMPEANQMNVENPNDPRSKSDKILYGLQHDDYVFCECEFAADIDYQLEAFEYGTTEKGSYAHSQAGVPYIPKDGFYKYRTNANPNSSPWYISGAIKVTKILDDNMVREILAKNGYEYRPRQSGKDIDLSEYGLKAGPVTPTEDLSSIAPGVDYSDEIKALPGYKRNKLNWNNPKFIDAFTIQKIEDKLETYKADYSFNESQGPTAMASGRVSANNTEAGNKETDSSNGIMCSLRPDALPKIHAIATNKRNIGDIQLTDNTPAIMLAQKGVKNLPLIMASSHLRQNILTPEEAITLGIDVEPEYYDHYHGLGEDLFKEIINDLDNVTLAYRGTKNADDPLRRDKYFLLVSQHVDNNGEKVIIPITIQQWRNVYNVESFYNVVNTVFGKNGFNNYIQRELRNGNLVRIKNNGTTNIGATEPISGVHNSNVIDDNIPQATTDSQVESDTRGSDRENSAIDKKAIKHFGTTEDFNEAGYILAGGEMLDFSGRHWGSTESGRRDVDHEDISEIYDKTGDNRLRFINEGNIRFSPEAPGINLSPNIEPTTAQYNRIKDFIRSTNVTSFYVDFEGKRDARLTYSGKVNADRVINDMKLYYSTGEVRQQSTVEQFSYSNRDDYRTARTDREILLEVFEDSITSGLDKPCWNIGA